MQNDKKMRRLRKQQKSVRRQIKKRNDIAKMLKRVGKPTIVDTDKWIGKTIKSNSVLDDNRCWGP